MGLQFGESALVDSLGNCFRNHTRANEFSGVGTRKQNEFRLGVALRLPLGHEKGCAGAVFLGFDDVAGLAIDEQQVISRASAGGVFAHGDAQASRKVVLAVVLNHPASLLELVVDLLAGLGFGCHGRA